MDGKYLLALNNSYLSSAILPEYQQFHIRVRIPPALR